MKIKIIFLLTLCAAAVQAAAQIKQAEVAADKYDDADKYIESAVIPMGGKKGFSFQTKAGDFMLKPYVLLQTAGKFNWYDDEQLGLDDQDNVANSGFEIPYAILGFSGRAFNKTDLQSDAECGQNRRGAAPAGVGRRESQRPDPVPRR